jgi:O-methyltransferase domain
VVSGASEILGGEIASRCQIVGGSFFDAVPDGANAYLLKGVIHDWPDADAIKILTNIRRAIPPGGTLLLVESLVDSATRPAGLADMLSMLMLAIGGRERTEADFRSLLASSHFSLARIIATEASSLIECHPVGCSDR